MEAGGGGGDTQKREKMRQEPRLKIKHVPTRLYKLIEIGRKKLRNAKKGCSKA